jgi:glyceraldehyde-3-phosphate dehydrogenase (NAD(P))
MPIRVAIAGYDAIGKRAADAVAAQTDMQLVGILEPQRCWHEFIRHKGHALWADDVGELAKRCDVLVNCGGEIPDGQPCVVIHGPEASYSAPLLFTALSSESAVRDCRTMKMATADVIAWARILRSIGELVHPQRLYASIITRAGRATESTCFVDSLQPLFDDELESEARRAIPFVAPELCVQRVRAPCTHSNLHMLKIEPAPEAGLSALMEALSRNSRIILVNGADGFDNTGLVQEFFRDMGRPRADRPEVLIWRESVAIADGSLYLMLDVEPDAAPIPELIDAIRICCTAGMPMARSMRQTDESLSLGSLKPRHGGVR